MNKKLLEQVRQQKESLIIDCIDALATANIIDVDNEESKEALEAAVKIIATYPGVENLKRSVLKGNNPDHYAIKAYTLLTGISLAGEASPFGLALINEALAYALQHLQDNIGD